MALFPRKYRSLLYKLVVIVPVLWLTVMLIAHNSNSGSSNLVPSGPGPDGLNPNEIQAAPHRKVLDGDASGVGNKDEVQIEEQKEVFREKENAIAAPTKKSAEVDRYVEKFESQISLFILSRLQLSNKSKIYANL